MSSAQIRHRSGNTSPHDGESDIASNRSKLQSFTRSDSKAPTQQAGLHASVWSRIFLIVASFTLLMVLISKWGKKDSIGMHRDVVRESDNVKDVRVKSSIGREVNPLFVTIVMPSVVKPEARPLRLSNIAKTWGPSSRAIYVVHDTNEYPEGANNRVDHQISSNEIYPKLLLVPESITVEQGVQRLEHVIRTVSKDINPDFAFFVNDHTFVLADHLCKFLKEHDSSVDLYAGHALKGNKETAFNSGAAGYVLSRSTINKLIEKWDEKHPKCSADNASKWLQGNPGLVTAQCFDQALHIPLVDTRDALDHTHKFHAFGLVRTVTGNVDEWYINKHNELDNILGVDELYHHRLQKGALCCSSDTISFHYVEAGVSVALWEILKTVSINPTMDQHEVKKFMITLWPKNRDGIGAYEHFLPADDSAVWNDLVYVVQKISWRIGVDDPSC